MLSFLLQSVAIVSAVTAAPTFSAADPLTPTLSYGQPFEFSFFANMAFNLTSGDEGSPVAMTSFAFADPPTPHLFVLEAVKTENNIVSGGDVVLIQSKNNTKYVGSAGNSLVWTEKARAIKFKINFKYSQCKAPADIVFGGGDVQNPCSFLKINTEDGKNVFCPGNEAQLQSESSCGWKKFEVTLDPKVVCYVPTGASPWQCSKFPTE